MFIFFYPLDKDITFFLIQYLNRISDFHIFQFDPDISVLKYFPFIY
jgi:hypothetical protein